MFKGAVFIMQNGFQIVYAQDPNLFKITLQNNWLIFHYMNNNQIKKFSINNINVIVIDEQKLLLSIPLITQLLSHQVCIIICNSKTHLPITSIVNQTYTLKHKRMVFNQIKILMKSQQEQYWLPVIKQKMINQINLLSGINLTKGNALYKRTNLQNASSTEAQLASLYFRTVYKTKIVRSSKTDEQVNAALNYGYTVLRSLICRSLYAHGFDISIGIHHISQLDKECLADDLIEPFRTLVDQIVFDYFRQNPDNSFSELKPIFWNLGNQECFKNQSKSSLENLIDNYIMTFQKEILSQNPNLLPKIKIKIGEVKR